MFWDCILRKVDIKKMSKDKEDVNKDNDTQCGIGIFRPSCLQPLADIKTFIGVFSTLSLITWSLYSIFVSQISNIEKAFGLSSAETGRLLTVWEIGYIVCTIIAGYFAPRAHIPRAIGYLTLLYGFAGLLTILPHFVAFTPDSTLDGNSTNNKANDNSDNLCINTSDLGGIHDANDPDDDKLADTRGSKRTLALGILYTAFILQGAAKSLCYPYSAQYVDDNSKKQNTGFFMGIISAIAIFGLAIGYGIGSLVSNVHVTLQDVAISSSDPRFISAWWLGMAVISFISFLIAIPMICLPRRVKNKHTASRDGASGKKRRSSNVQEEVKVAAKTLFKIIKSPIYMTMLFAASFNALATACFFGFEPKYMETQFSIPSWKVNLIVGVASITSFSAGSLIGGYVTKRFNFTPFFNVLFILVLAFINIGVVSVMIFIGCSQPEVIKDPSELTNSELYQPTGCNCTDAQFLPICGSDGHSWFSPCHAGCTSGSLKEFSDCSAMPGGEAKVGLCPSECSMLWPYIVLKVVHNVVDAISSIPVFLVLLRSAGEEHKSLAIALSAAIMSIISWLPGPSIGGGIVDSACVVWKKATSTSGNYCAFYNIEKQRHLMYGSMLGMRILSMMLVSATLFFARNLKSWEGDSKLNNNQHGVGVNSDVELMIHADETIETSKDDADETGPQTHSHQ